MQSLSTHDQRMLSYDYRWSQFKSGASRRNISVDIDKRQYTQLICSPCHYCARAPAAAFRIGIDRIDSSKAYTSSNCVSCCKSCNFMKNTMRYDDFISQALLVAQVHSSGSMKHCTEQRQRSSPRHLHGHLLPQNLHTPQVHVHHHYHVHHCEYHETTCEKNMPTEAAATGVFL